MHLFLVSLLLPSTIIQVTYATLPPITPTATSTLVPPFGDGPATYYASALGFDQNGTSYAITCVPPSIIASPTANADPCQTSIFGTSPITFYQGSSLWQVIRRPNSSAYHSTGCSLTPSFRTRYTYITSDKWQESTIFPSAVPTCQALPTPSACFTYDDEGGDRLNSSAGVREVAMCDLGLKEQEVLMVDALPTTAPPTTTFTDIGKSSTTQGPVQTITLHKIGGNAGTIRKGVGRGAVLVAVTASVVFGLG